jgi:hypothetical protein
MIRKKVNMARKQQESFLKEKIRDISYEHPCDGYQRITAQLPRENININHKLIYFFLFGGVFSIEIYSIDCGQYLRNTTTIFKITHRNK